MIYYARPSRSPDRSTWQTLQEHIDNVANLTAKFADKFNSSSFGYLLGKSHDLGKYLTSFQRKFDGDKNRVEHSGAGAFYLSTLYPERIGALTLGQLLSFPVACHHGGLINKALRLHRTPLFDRLENNREVFESVKQHIDIKELPSISSLPNLSSLQDAELWIRFLFSCLVDADRLDAERFSSPETFAKRGQYSSLIDLNKKLLDFVSKLNNVQSSTLNTLRKNVQDTCFKMANNDKGFFSLQVPTGGGKTISSMCFALSHAIKHNFDRVIICIPYTSIIEQTAKVYKEIFGEHNVIEHHSNFDAELKYNDIEELDQYELACDNWDAPIVVTTNVQFFETLFARSAKRCRKLHNINNSVVICDEVQTLEPTLLSTILDGMKQLVRTYKCSIVLSTATLPALEKSRFVPYGLENVVPIIPQSGDLKLSDLYSQLKRVQYNIERSSKPIKIEDLAKEIAEHKQVLCIVNTRRTARELTLLVKQYQPNAIHLSTLMCPEHRIKEINKIKQLLESKESCVVISTQLVEAGVCIDFPVVYRERSGIDNIIQSGGRCNREGKLSTCGKTIVFRLEEENKLPPTIKQAIDCSELIFKRANYSIDMNNPNVPTDYFYELYIKKNLDKQNVQVSRGEFNYETVGQKFKLINDEDMLTVLVPYANGNDLIKKFLDKNIKTYSIDGETKIIFTQNELRKAQMYSVNLYKQDFMKLESEGKITTIGTTFNMYIIKEKDMYSIDFGLMID